MFEVETPNRSASSQRSLDESRTVPELKILFAGNPVRRIAAVASTSHGLVTKITIASGECLSKSGSKLFRISKFTPASSKRVCPGFCFAPAVITITSEFAVKEISAPPVIEDEPVNCVPCAKSRTSAFTLDSFTSYKTT